MVHPGRRRQSTLDRIRRAPTSPSTDGLVGGLRRLEEILSLGARQFNLGRIPQGRIDAMARYVAKAKAAEIERMPAEWGDLGGTLSPEVWTPRLGQRTSALRRAMEPGC